MNKNYLINQTLTLLFFLFSMSAFSQSNYCIPFWTAWTVNEPTEPITSVQFGQSDIYGINHHSSEIISIDTPRYQDLSDISAEVMRGETYFLKMKGNTNGNNTNYFTVYFDWNGNGVFSNAMPQNEQVQQQLYNQPEKHQYLPVLVNSTGLDNIEVIHSVVIPNDAIIGLIGMRIVKNYNAPSNDPCNNPFLFGQIEDYTLNVTENNSEYEVMVTTQNNLPAKITTENGTLQLVASINPSTINQEVIWSIEEGEEFANINENGLVTAVSNGTCVVRATSLEDDTKFDKLEVSIQATTDEGYCEEVSVDFDVEPISLVSLSNLNNNTSTIINDTPAYEDFTSMEANLERGETYLLIVKGNTGGNFEHDIRVFIDWNKDFDFDMETEFYTESLFPSTGEDNVKATLQILVPENAVLGETRMRITKDMWNSYNDGEFNACTNAYYGQIEDYTLNITEANSDYEIVVNTQDNLPAEIITENGTLQLVASINPSTVNQEVIWSIEEGEEFANIDENGLVTAVSNGVCVVRATSLEDDTKFDELEININMSLSINEVDFNSIQVYPNPVKEVLTISAENNISEIQLFNVLGQQVLNRKEKNNFVSVDLSMIPKGSYFLKIRIGDKQKIKKLIKL